MGKKRERALVEEIEFQIGKVNDLQSRLDLDQARREKEFDEALIDLFNSPDQRLLVVTPGGKILRGVATVTSIDVEALATGCGSVSGLRSAEVSISLQP